MRRLHFSAVAAGILAIGSLSAIAAAQERSSPVRPGNGQIPPGSYQQSCRGANMNGNMLSAQCTGPTGAPIYSTIDTNGCRGRDIANDQGYLRCGSTGGPQPPRPDPIPSGSYQQSCRGANMNGNMLSAQCTGPTGAPIYSTIDTNGCRGRDIANDQGYLRCGSTGGPQPPRPPRPEPPTPPGGGNYEAVLYTSAGFRGQSMRVTGPTLNLANWPGFNDNVRSIQILRGRAHIGTDSFFRGRCVTLDRSIRDLNQIGMGNRISSVR